MAQDGKGVHFLIEESVVILPTYVMRGQGLFFIYAILARGHLRHGQLMDERDTGPSPAPIEKRRHGWFFDPGGSRGWLGWAGFGHPNF